METEKRGWRTLLQGQPGTGKSTALNSLVETCGLEVFCVMLEPGMHVLKPNPKMHWKYINTFTQSWDTLREAAVSIRSFKRDALVAMDGHKSEFKQYFDFLVSLNNFTDEEGKKYGSVEDWGTDRVLVIDGLTGLSKIAMSLVTGDRVARTVSDYGLAMGNLENLLDKITLSLKCHFVLISHLESEKDETSGAYRTMVSTLGNKLAPLVPANFSESVLAYRQGKEFLWSTLDSSAVLKHFYLPMANDLEPTFTQLHESWKAKES